VGHNSPKELWAEASGWRFVSVGLKRAPTPSTLGIVPGCFL
jgi:hypothetical protein